MENEMQRLVSVMKKRMRSGSQEESDSKRLKDLFDGDFSDFLTLLDAFDTPTTKHDDNIVQEPEMINTVTEATALVNKDGEGKVNESLNFNVLKEPAARNDLLEIFAPLFKQLNSDFRNSLASLQSQIESKDKKILELTKRVDDLENQNRRKNLRIQGIDYREGEDVNQKVCDNISKLLKIKLKPSDIDESFRLNKRGSKPTSESPILVKLNKYEVKRQIYSSKKLLKDTVTGTKIYINEDLSKSRADLYKKVRQLRKDRLIWKTWTNNSRIYFTLDRNDALPKEITDENCVEILRSTLTPISSNG